MTRAIARARLRWRNAAHGQRRRWRKRYEAAVNRRLRFELRGKG